ncbi:MAG: hypothetical protein GY939_01555 [Actinomycetia bacterium]|nr:hypothetical protein [Actinomycetes bacterium]
MMSRIRISRRIAAAVLAATLALGGAVGVAASADDQLDTPGTEEAGRGFGFGHSGSVSAGAYGQVWASTQSATWS